MRSRLTIVLLAILLTSNSLTGAQAMPRMIMMNLVNPELQIIPLPEARLLVPAIDNLPPQPPGSFILKNVSDRAITAVVVQWSYVQKDGTTIKRGINCDGYAGTTTWVVVKPLGLSLITPDGCTGHESFSRLTSGQATINKPIPLSEQIAQIELTLDSVIYEDGQIWGPDHVHYYKKIWERYSASQAVVNEIVAAQNAGEEIGPHLTRIRNEARASRDKQSGWKEHYAGLIERSPNREGTIKQLQAQGPPPEFRHIGGEKQ